MKRKGRVQWKPETMNIGPQLRPHPFIVDGTTPANFEALAQHLVVGSLWQTAAPMGPDTRYPGTYYQQHELQYLSVAPYFPTFRMGTPAVYVGTVRVEEEKHRGDMIRVARHVFFIGGSRYMATNLMDFIPVL